MNEERLRRIEDRLELLELPARYSRAIDDRDIPALIELFCDDGVFDRVERGLSIVGRPAIERFYRDVLAGYGMSIHTPHAQVVDRIEGDEASGWAMSHAELAIGEEYVVVALRYHDDYARVDGRWRFKRRRLHYWYFARWDELGKIVPSTNRLRVRGEPRPADLPDSLPTFLEFIGSQPV